MSLDVSLVVDRPITKVGTGVFVRKAGKNVELTSEEVLKRWPDAHVQDEEYPTNEVYDANITHNLGKMAQAADIYTALWRPDEQGWTTAKDIVGMLERGLKRLKKDPENFKKLNPENGWGSYDGLVQFVEEYLAACRAYPDAKIEVSR